MTDPMVEKVARALAFSAGAAIVGPGQSRATREFGWKGDGEHFQQYVERHWQENINAAELALGAAAAYIADRWGSEHPGAIAIHHALGDIEQITEGK